jgi:hypothetical protein
LCSQTVGATRGFIFGIGTGARGCLPSTCKHSNEYVQAEQSPGCVTVVAHGQRHRSDTRRAKLDTRNNTRYTNYNSYNVQNSRSPFAAPFGLVGTLCNKREVQPHLWHLVLGPPLGAPERPSFCVVNAMFGMCTIQVNYHFTKWLARMMMVA